MFFSLRKMEAKVRSKVAPFSCVKVLRNSGASLTFLPMSVFRRNSFASSAHGSELSLSIRGARIDESEMRFSAPPPISVTISVSPETTSTTFTCASPISTPALGGT